MIVPAPALINIILIFTLMATEPCILLIGDEDLVAVFAKPQL